MRTTRKLAKATGKVAKDVLSSREAAMWLFWLLMAAGLLLVFWAVADYAQDAVQNGTESSRARSAQAVASGSTQSASSRP